MLLRLEIDGFKNLVDFAVAFGPFTCIGGENGVGKSNVFDAIQFLSLIADGSLLNAAQEVRSSRTDSAGEPDQLFTAGLPGRRMRLVAEMVVPRQVEDDFGASVSPTITLLRYELELGYEAPDIRTRQGRLVVEREELHHINRGDAHKHFGFGLSVSQFRNAIVKGERRGAFISTDVESQRITVHQDGGSRGRPKRGLPIRATTTVVSTINTADDPTILAARREMQSWRRLALEPTALRSVDRFADSSVMESDGKHLASTLYRIATSAEDPADVYARVAGRLSGLAGVDIRSLRVEVDDVRQSLSIVVTDGQGQELPARALSEGTLRYLALCVLLEDATVTGLVTMEEPENGIHPANLNQIVQLVRDLAVDSYRPPDHENPLRQIIVNTHSPGVIQLVGKEDLLVASQHYVKVESVRVRALRLRAIRGSWRQRAGLPFTEVADLADYLTRPVGVQLSLPGLDVA